jgi:hypothetical protein
MFEEHGLGYYGAEVRIPMMVMGDSDRIVMGVSDA